MKPTVYMMLGLPGSGKTTFSKKLEAELSLPRFSLDGEYFALTDNKRNERRDYKIEKQARENIKTKVANLISEGKSVISDFCPWNGDERADYVSFIESSGGVCKVYYFDVPKEELVRRLTIRNQNLNQDTQYVTPQMLEDFYQRFDVPTNEDVEIVK